MRIWHQLICRLFHPRDYWHNRHFDGRYRAHRDDPGHWTVAWEGRAVKHRPLQDLAVLPHPPVCHVIASGPSLALLREPVRLFADFTICMNGSFRLAKQVGKPCDLYLTNDGGFIRRRWADFREGATIARHVLLDHLMLFFLLERDLKLATELDLLLYDDPNRPYLATAATRRAEITRTFQAGVDYISHPRLDRIWISRHPAIGIARDASVVCSALQAAWLMHFKEVRIYGMDLGGPSRFYHEGKQPEPSRLDRNYENALLPWFQEFAARCCGPDFRVFNCSDSSRLPAEVLPRRDPNVP